MLKDASEWVLAALNIALVLLRKHTDVVIGGSYAKRTLVTSPIYDIDVFIRYRGDIAELTQALFPALREICMQHRFPLERVHGSRDYFRIVYSPSVVFEIIPVTSIKKPSEATNVTDLSYAHIGYIRKELRKNKKLIHEIGLAKRFCKAQQVYGAESYVGGFSGYALECLIIVYGSFLKMVKRLVSTKEQIILDPAKHYKHKREITLSLNESKLRSPIVLVDPTWKERNVLAALSSETFAKFQKSAREFLKRPTPSFFIAKPITEADFIARARKLRTELVCLMLETPKQPGDIAGTKLKKFADVISRHVSPHFVVADRAFIYTGGHTARAYYFVKPGKIRLHRGPPLSMKEHAHRFKREHRNAIVKRGVMYAPLPRPASAREYLIHFLQRYEKMVREMDVISAKVV